MSHLSRNKPEKDFFKNCVGGKFFWDFFGVFPRSTHNDASIELSFVLFCCVEVSKVQYHSKIILVTSKYKIFFWNNVIINFSDTTHLICARSGTQKYRQAKKEKIKIVNPAWLWVTYHNWDRQTEDNFELPDIASPEDLEGLKFQMFEIVFGNFTEFYVTEVILW